MGFRDLLKGATSGFSDLVQGGLEQAVSNIQKTATASMNAQAAATQQHTAPPAREIQMTGPAFEPIQGVSLEKYANLLVQMCDVGEDAAACIAVAEANGVSRVDWEAAKDGWTARMSDPAMEDVRQAFVRIYGPAMDKMRGGQEPIRLEDFVRIFTESSFRKDPNDPSKLIDREVLLKENNLTGNQWNECLYYWTPKVSDPNHPRFRDYQMLLDQHIKRLSGRR